MCGGAIVVRFGVRYVVRGPAGQRALATVRLRLTGVGSLYTVAEAREASLGVTGDRALGLR